MTAGLHGIIVGGVSAADFNAVTGINIVDSETILDDLAQSGIGTRQNNMYHFQDGDKLQIATLLLENGSPIDEIAAVLNWRDFEGLTGKIMSSKNFAVIKNMMLTKPRMEIDVVGIRMGIAVLIDCKHWKRYSPSSLSSAVRKQIRRTVQYVAKTQGAMAVPVIVTLYQDRINFIENVPIVPILQFSSFIDEFYGNLDQVRIIKRD